MNERELCLRKDKIEMEGKLEREITERLVMKAVLLDNLYPLGSESIINSSFFYDIRGAARHFLHLNNRQSETRTPILSLDINYIT